MTYNSYYLQSFKNQCDCLLKTFHGESDCKKCRKIFCTICEHLEKDFLPPIEREDIAMLSYLILKVAKSAEDYKNESNDDVAAEIIGFQLKSFYTVITAIFQKRKTCGEIIRRLIEKNSECTLNSKEKTRNLNGAISEFFRAALVTYFKNL